MRVHIAERGGDGLVGSAGLLEGGRPCPEALVETMSSYGIDVTAHRSRQVTPAIIDSSDLIVAAERFHVREVAIRARGSFPRLFTFRELVRRGEEIRARQPHQSLEEWLELVHGERTPSDLMGKSPADDIADPYLGPVEAYQEVCLQLAGLTRQLTDLLWPRAMPGASRTARSRPAGAERRLRVPRSP